MDILLIGPISTGKTTLAPILGEKLGLPVVSVDPLRWQYFDEIGYDKDHAQMLREVDFFEMVKYWKPFEAHTLERVLADHKDEDCIFEFGAGYTVQDDPALFARVKAAFAPYKNVVLILPSPDAEESLQITKERLEAEAAEEGWTLGTEMVDINRHFIESPCNPELATITVYTKDQTPEETADSILQQIKHNGES